MATMCSYKGRIVKMTDEEMQKSLLETEKKLRTGNFQYVVHSIQPKVDHLKKTWSKEAQVFVKTSANAIAKSLSGGNIKEDTVQRAITETCKTYVAQIRAKKNNTEAANEYLYMTGEIALASLFNMSPDTDEDPKPRCYGTSTKTIRVKSSSVPKRLVIDEERAKEADIYVQAVLIKNLETAMLVGWATQADVLASKKGNKTTDTECNWVKTAYYMPLERLRPMSELMSECGLKEVPSGIVFEKTPTITDIPIMTSPESQLMLISAPPKKEESFDDFLKSSGIESATTVTGVEL